MHYSHLLETLGNEVLFSTSLLVVGNNTQYQVQRRLSDWSKAKKIVKLRRGLYVLPKTKRSFEPHPYLIANRLVTGSYVSLETALRHYNLIPEHVAVITSLTTGRPGEWKNEFGRFIYRHIQPRYFFGIQYRLIVGGQYIYIAYPEKALLDLIYLRKEGDSPEFIFSLRLQNLEELDLSRLKILADRFDKPKLQRASAIIRELALQERAEYESL
jgi:predicted transcriptional regulator of viral defense system